MSGKYLDATIVSRRRLTDRIAEFEIGAADGRPLPMAEAGSHVEVRFGGEGGRFLRHYSLVGPLTIWGDPDPFWRIAVQLEHRSRGSAFIHEHFRSGTSLKVSRPISAFRLSRNQPHALLVAGGIGVTPIFAMARSSRLRGAAFSVFYAGLERATMAFVEELSTMSGGRLTVHETARHGLPDFGDLLASQPSGTVAYVCGPAGMIEAVRDSGAALGWEQDRVRFEAFNAAHRPDDEDFAVRLRSGRMIKVGAGTTILDALEAAGIDTLSDCRRGECGLCVADVAGCDGELDHRDRFFTEEEHRAGTRMTICCSRTTGRVLDLDV